VEHSGGVFACETHLIAHPTDRQRAIAVQCIARCNEAILVDAVLRGAANVFILNASCTECLQYKLGDLVQTMAETANRLLECWKYPAVIGLTRKIPEKIKPLTKTGRNRYLVGASRTTDSTLVRLRG
jgi:hypothetical protein